MPPRLPSVGQLGRQQLPPYSTEPLGQPQVLPQPSDMPPRLPSVGQLAVQQLPMYSVVPDGQGQVPPQPLLMPPRLPSAGQVGRQQLPPYSTEPLGQPQVLLQPSGIPPRLPSAGQLGVHTQLPPTQRPLVPHPAAPQLQVSMQVPLLHTLPAAQRTPAHRLTTQVPPAHTWLAAQVTLAHGLVGLARLRSQVLPGPQAPLQVLRATHLLAEGEQYCPAGQVAPLHGCGKQPATHSPSTQVWPALHVLLAQGSVTCTQDARQTVPGEQIGGAVTQGSGWQAPLRQT